MAAIPFLCRGVWFSPKLSHHRNASLAVYLPIFYFSFCQKTNLHVYKWSRLSSLLFTLFMLYVLCLFSCLHSIYKLYPLGGNLNSMKGDSIWVAAQQGYSPVSRTPLHEHTILFTNSVFKLCFYVICL